MSSLRGHIAFQQIGLGEILKQYRLAVPANQREYSWTEREVTMLLQDLAKAINDGDGDYFLGTVVTIPRSEELLEVVDGQQRLATTAIVLCEIRNYLFEREPLIAEFITNSFLTEIDKAKRERVSKLQLNLDDNEYFRLMVAEQKATRPAPTKHSHALLKQAFDLAHAQVRKIVAGLNQKDHGDVLNRWIEFVQHHAQVNLLKVPSDANAYKMFETLNDRGLKTSQSDLVKNYLFGEAGARLGEAQQKWALMRGALETLDEEDVTVTFLRHALIAIRGYLRESEVYEAVQAQARGAGASVTFLSTLETLSIAYVAMLNPEHEKWNKYPDTIRRAIQTLNLLNIRPIRPLMIAVANRFNPKEAAAAFQSFISWGVRLLIAGTTRSGSVEQPLSAAAHSVFVGDITTAKALKAKLANVIPTDEEFRQAFEIATVSKASLARYYLRALEMKAKGEASPWFIPNDDRQTINLEHVFPVHPEGNWPRFDDEAARTHARRIGNLALLTAKGNSDSQSLDFQTKKAVYKEAPYELTSQIASVAEWGPSQIAERQKTLAKLAVQTWPL